MLIFPIGSQYQIKTKKRESRTCLSVPQSEAFALPIVVERTEFRGLTRNMNVYLIIGTPVSIQDFRSYPHKTSTSVSVPDYD